VTDPDPTNWRQAGLTIPAGVIKPAGLQPRDAAIGGPRTDCRFCREGIPVAARLPGSVDGYVPAVALGGNTRRIRRELREQLTRGERAFWYGMVVLVTLLSPLAIGMLVFGGDGVRPAGIGLLFAALAVYAVPVTPILRARVRRRESRRSAE
jgi:hypothetical protein